MAIKEVGKSRSQKKVRGWVVVGRRRDGEDNETVDADGDRKLNSTMIKSHSSREVITTGHWSLVTDTSTLLVLPHRCNSVTQREVTTSTSHTRPRHSTASCNSSQYWKRGTSTGGYHPTWLSLVYLHSRSVRIISPVTTQFCLLSATSNRGVSTSPAFLPSSFFPPP